MRVKVFFLLLVVMTGMLLPVFSVKAQTTAEDPRVTIHVVQRGENLFRISQQYGLTVEEIAQVNGIVNVSNLDVGQRLIIPLAPVQPAISEPVEHVVQPGETLMTISGLYGLSIDQIAGVNGIANPNAIYVGQVLTIDSGVPEPVAAPELERVDITHVVQRGQTLFVIASTYGASVAAIQEANELENPELIYAGQTLIIPDVEVPQNSSVLPSPVSSVVMDPLVLVQGRSSRLRVTTTGTATVAGTFLDQPLSVFSEQNGTMHTAYIGVAVDIPPNIYALTLNVSPQGGVAVPIVLNVLVTGVDYGVESVTLPANLSSLLAPGVEQNEVSILTSVAARVTPERYFTGPMSLPAAAVMNSPYGASRSYNGGIAQSFHAGSDFAAPPGAPVLASAPGRVVLADTLYIRGNTIMIDHGWGIFTLYAHMADRYAQVGQIVDTGAVLGTVGTTGRSTGAHLHWELWVNGVPVDPMQWVSELLP